MNLVIGGVFWIEVLLIHGVRRACVDHIDRGTWLMIGACALCIMISVCYIHYGTGDLQAYMENSVREGGLYKLITSNVATVLVLASVFALMILFFSIISRMNNLLKSEQQARQMAHQANLALDQARVVRENLDSVARLRHDLKNHLLAIDTLGQNGEWDRQRRYLDDMRARLDKDVMS